jgi:type I restriction enzyme, S subunit
MNPVVMHFDRIADAPDALPRLRQFTLALAVRGKLVPQDPVDEPSSEFLKRIHLRPSDRVPFPIPSSWNWISVGEIGESRLGKMLDNAKNKGLPRRYLRNVNVRWFDFDLSDVFEMRFEDDELDEFALRNGDVLICEGGEPGRAAVWDEREEDIYFQKAIHRVRFSEAVDPRFFVNVIREGADSGRLSEYFTGVGIKHFTGKGLSSFVFPLPPRAEQHRIVAKVDEVMALCNRLEAAEKAREGRRARLTTVALHNLDNSEKHEAMLNQARFYLTQLPRLTTRIEDIRALRQTILDLAVRGRLVPQDSSEEPACKLLKRIQAEKTRLMAEGTLREEKPLSPIMEDQTPFSVPTSWSWARIGTCSLLTEYGTSVRSDTMGKGVPVLTMGDIQGGQVILNERKKVSSQIDDLPQLFLKQFDLLYNRTNSAELVGKTGIFLGEDDVFTFASYLIRIRFLGSLTSPVYSNMAMNAPYFRPTQIVPELRQQCGQANVNGSKLRNMMIPLPPFAEQQRIVAKVQELMALCDRLEEQLHTSQTETARLLEAVLDQALNPKKAEMEPVKALNG